MPPIGCHDLRLAPTPASPVNPCSSGAEPVFPGSHAHGGSAANPRRTRLLAVAITALPSGHPERCGPPVAYSSPLLCAPLLQRRLSLPVAGCRRVLCPRGDWMAISPAAAVPDGAELSGGQRRPGTRAPGSAHCDGRPWRRPSPASHGWKVSRRNARRPVMRPLASMRRVANLCFASSTPGVIDCVAASPFHVIGCGNAITASGYRCSSASGEAVLFNSFKRQAPPDAASNLPSGMHTRHVPTTRDTRKSPGVDQRIPL